MSLHKYLVLHSSPIFTTRDFAIQTNVSVSSATRYLSGLERKKELVRITRGLWLFEKEETIHPFSIVPYLLGNEQGYISLLSALHLHGVLSQIPTRVQIVSTGHAKLVKTKIAIYEFFQMKPEMMTEGVEWTVIPQPFRMATPERALLDALYLSTRKGKRFSSFPELDFKGSHFKEKSFRKLLKSQKFPTPIHLSIQEKFENLLICNS